MTADPEAVPLRRWLAAAAAAVVCLACGDDPTGGGRSCGQEIPVGVGATVAGRLEAGDARFADAYIDYFALQLSNPVSLRVALTSSQFDPLLFIFDESQNVVEQAFDADGAPDGESETASLTRVFEPGCYIVGASSWGSNATGAYVVTVDEGA